MTDFIETVNSATLGKVHLFALGQAGFLIKNAFGKLIAVDPYLSDCVMRIEGHDGYKRLLPKLFAPEEISLDVLICTHFHRDHYDIDSVPALMRSNKTKLFCPVDCKVDMAEGKLDSKAVEVIAPGDRIETNDCEITFLNCDHGDGAPKAVGVAIETNDIKIVEVGDTALRLDRVAEIVGNKKVDVLIAPINGAYGNMNEAECVELANAVKPDLVIPCHYGMFASHGGNPGLFREIMIEKSNVKYLLMAQGEKYTIGE